jgi:hypothetical protein
MLEAKEYSGRTENLDVGGYTRRTVGPTCMNSNIVTERKRWKLTVGEGSWHRIASYYYYLLD